MNLIEQALEYYTESYVERVKYYKEAGFSTLEAVQEVDDEIAQQSYEACNCEEI
jgi:hypothetical protein